MSKLQEIQRTIGYGMPYVFVESVKLSDGSTRSEDRSFFTDTSLNLKANKFGTNETQAKSEAANTDYFTSQATNVRLSLSIPELLVGSRWYGKESTQDMTIHVVQSTHPLATSALMGMRKYVEEDLPDNIKPFVKEVLLSIPGTTQLSDHKVKEMPSIQDTLCMIPLTVSFNINSNHLTYFLYSEAGGRSGHVTVERVMDNARTKRTSTSFSTSDGQIWSGPVHYHNEGGWMAGAKHNSKSHASLQKIEHNNFKIQDHRVFRQLENIQNEILLTRSEEEKRIFSDLYLARDLQGAARGLFVVNIERLLSLNSKYNNLFFTADIDKLMSYSSIQELRVYRSKVENKNTNDYDYEDQTDAYALVAKSSDDPARGSLLRKDYFIDENADGTLEKYVGSIAEKAIVGLGNKRSFSFYDSEIQEFESGEYRYGIELFMVDPTARYLQLQIKGLEKSYNILNEYYLLASDKRYYNSVGELDMRSIAHLGKVYGSSGNLESTRSSNSYPWRRSVDIYLDVLKQLSGVTVSSYRNSLYSILAPTSKTLSGVEAFLKLLEGFIQKMASLGATTTSSYSDKRSVANSSKMQESSLVELDYLFDSVFDAGIVTGFGIDYYGDSVTSNYTGPVTITLADFSTRASKKAARLGITLPPADDLEGYTNFYSKLNPMRIYTNTDVYELENSSNMSEEDLKRAQIQISKMRANPNNSGIRTPDAGGSTDDMLGTMLSEQGTGTTVTSYTDATTASTEQAINSNNFMPGGQLDSFAAQEAESPSGTGEPPANPIGGASLDVVGDLISVGDQPLLEQEEVEVRYVNNFNDDMEMEFVRAPFASPRPFLMLLERGFDREQILNYIAIMGSTDTSGPTNEEDEEEEEPITEEPEVEEEYPEVPSYEDSDNSDTIPETNHSINAEEVVVAVTTATSAAPRPQAPRRPTSTISRTEQTQTYLVGRGSNQNGY